MARKATIIDVVTDVEGKIWDVREIRDTDHKDADDGFKVYFGWPQDITRGKGGSGPSVILTQGLAQYLQEARLKDVELPICRTAVKKLRKQLGVGWDWDNWWAERQDDLMSMTLEAFALKHGCSTGAASQRRKAARQADQTHDAKGDKGDV